MQLGCLYPVRWLFGRLQKPHPVFLDDQAKHQNLSDKPQYWERFPGHVKNTSPLLEDVLILIEHSLTDSTKNVDLLPLRGPIHRQNRLLPNGRLVQHCAHFGNYPWEYGLKALFPVFPEFLGYQESFHS